MTDWRIEKDFLGEVKIPKERYWGIHTQRALNNFPYNNKKIPFEFIQGIVYVKKAAILTNWELEFIDDKIKDALILACDDILEGNLKEEFPLDILQGGAGTSLNMNINEVLANRALEILGYEKGRYDIIHPIETVNKNQSTNDVVPTGLRVASLFLLDKLSEKIAKLQGAFQVKEKEFTKILKIGRTELQSAVPITLGMEFSGYSEAISRDRWRVWKSQERIRVSNLGGTAIGTGIAADRDYIYLVIEKLRELINLNISRAENLIGQTAFIDDFVEVSGILKAHASNLIKISNDLRLLNLLGEIKLPPRQTGSSIMPSKINPVILESIIQSGIKVISNDKIITETASFSTLQIIEFLPLLGSTMIESLKMLIVANEILTDYVLEIKANEKKCLENLINSPTLITLFIPIIGYRKAEELIKEYYNTQTNISIGEFFKQKLGEEVFNRVLDPYYITSLGYRRDLIEKLKQNLKNNI